MLSSKFSLKGQGSLSCHVCGEEVGSFLKQQPVQKLLEEASLQKSRAVRQETLAEADHEMRLCRMKWCCSHCCSGLGLYTELRRAHCSESSSDFNYESVNQSIKFPQKTNGKQKRMRRNDKRHMIGKKFCVPLFCQTMWNKRQLGSVAQGNVNIVPLHAGFSFHPSVGSLV